MRVARPLTTVRSSRHRAVDALFHTGLLDAANGLWRDRLVVLAYHRICDPAAPDFTGLTANVSATPEDFDRQLDLLQRWCNVVSLATVLDWLDRGTPLPPRAALITFDDGYRDNFDHAWPSLKVHNLPAVLFLTTGCVGSSQPFWWDLVANGFAGTTKTLAELPLLGRCRLDDTASRSHALAQWCAMAKRLPADSVPAAAHDLLCQLEVTCPSELFAGLHLSWEQVRRLSREGMAIGAHTVSHPALSRLSLTRARVEARQSKAGIEQVIGQTVEAFAYPFGGIESYLPEHASMLAEEGFRAAFSLREGPQSLTAVRRERMRVRRVAISHRDDIIRFAAKLVGLGRLKNHFEFGSGH
jgi:peptidoglycan/xylan/chitin deacetylase (PgdA/CDA1 family)